MAHMKILLVLSLFLGLIKSQLINNDLQELQQLKIETAIRAFTVQNSIVLENVPKGYTVAFDLVLTNEKRRYNSKSGIFTADISGLYLFLLNIRVRYYNKLCYSELVRNNNKVVVTMSMSGTKFHQHSSERNFGIIQLDIGDKVWVRSSPLTETGKTCSIDDA
ncbi:unnamed protein product [Mytilus edulis]|uniref:C1q domain-containing protein n=1 Tax=Mytilus edulis TaxID=6550 RepID=A0A8S3QK21_MYTED|nr:unnamed protein product [Mytilus edulis]